MTDAVTKHEQWQIAGAMHYAHADASDPFTLNRALCHIRQGICRPRNEASEEYGLPLGANAGYTAMPVPKQCITSNGVEYVAIVYHTRVRP